ncbi:MAG: COX15/CtaA family protein [Pseudomonadota bacterium]|nr:COX15/CtaA family protein [Pseudomonadota bacterium]
MPFDVRDFPGAVQNDRAVSRRNRRLAAGWLFTVCGMILVMIVLGGVTRLTGSGLSIMEWAPVRGIVPPLGRADWDKLFALYQQIPQYKLLHQGFGLAGFKQIFWLEWVHRLWGRLVGLAFFVPLVWLWATGRIGRALRPRLAVIFVLGGLQGAVGWLMVASGFFPDSTSVAPARLVIHLGLALVLYAAILWTGLGLLRPVASGASGGRLLRPTLLLCAATLALTILAGGFVAGTHAGLAYNTFPLMDGRLIPADYGHLHPWLRNLTQNIPAVQFDHRLLATLTALLGGAAVGAAWRTPLARGARAAVLALAGLVMLQYALGVATLLLVVPVSLAAAHQANAVLALTAALVALHALRPAPMPTPTAVASRAPR